jgi:hypothetical protein
VFLPVSFWPFLTSYSHLPLATQRLGSLSGVLVWEVLSRMFVTWHVLDKGFLCNLKHYAHKYIEKHLKITVKLIDMRCQVSCVGFVNISSKSWAF